MLDKMVLKRVSGEVWRSENAMKTQPVEGIAKIFSTCLGSYT